MPENTTCESDMGITMASKEGQLVVFKLNDVEFGVNIHNVREIVRLPEVTPIPRSPDYVSGVCNLRGGILPVIDTRIRFAMERHEKTEDTRLLIVENDGINAGLVVDKMREVTRMSDALVEHPPAVCKGIDREFLDSVVKMDGGRRLILTLNLAEVIKVDISKNENMLDGKGCDGRENDAHKESVDEEQLVSFHVSGEEYAFDIEKVREILKVKNITPVPNVPDYVRGLFTIRDQLIPVIDLRRLLGLPDLSEERIAAIDAMEHEHRRWLETLKHSLDAGTPFEGTMNPRKCSYGKWLEHYNTASEEIQTAIKRLKRPHALVHASAEKTINLRKTCGEEALECFEKETRVLMEMVLEGFANLKKSIEENITEDQRVLVVMSGTFMVGYLVDSVNEVSRILKSVIDEAPEIVSTQKKELKGVAKLDGGDRLIMIIDETSLISPKSEEIIRQAAAGDACADENSGSGEKPSAEDSMDEEQLVTFSVGDEEYGLRIVDVREINRPEGVMSVPRAPFFIDGVTNLRGNVIPVVNIRKLFGLEENDVDDRTRVIIADIAGKKTGLRVDQVNEVLTVLKSDIENTPSIISSNAESRFINGLCKLDEGRRIVLLLDLGMIFNENEVKLLAKLGKQTESDVKGMITAEETQNTAQKKTKVVAPEGEKTKTGTEKTNNSRNKKLKRC